MATREKYRQLAIACAKQAETIRDPAERAVMLQVAHAYLKLADRIGAHYDRGTAHRDDGDRPIRSDS